MNAVRSNNTFAVLAGLIVIGLAGCQTMSVNDAMSSGAMILQASSVTDAEMMQQAKVASLASDKAHRVAAANSKYQKRINALSKNLKSVNGIPLNIKVYMTKDINAFAMPDGTIRVYSGLMDAMNDDETLFILGHEIGHIAKGHSKQRMRTALLTKAGREIVTKTANASVAALTASQLGDLTEAVINAQFSQANEREADDYGLATLQQSGKNPEAAATALEKLAAMSGQGSNFVAQMVSTHPEPGARAARIRKAIR